MKVFVTGNRGYIGVILANMLKKRSYSVVGLDVDLYSGCELEPFDTSYPQITKDIREVSMEDIEGIDAIIHLGALSNDPLGEFSPITTNEVNLLATLKLARLAKKTGVKRFVFASSQSMYGVANTEKELDEENSEKNPVTEYAKAKWEAELELKKIATPDFLVACFRPSTVFGASPQFRCDIVFNNLVACAYTTGKIEIKSDGTPWRPVVHVRDVCQAFIAGLEAPEDIVGGKSFNVGIPDGNFTVFDLAKAAQRCVPGCEIIITNEHTDPRTYRVSFRKILTELKEFFKPEWDLFSGGRELVEFFEKVNFTEDDFRGRRCNRLKQLEYLQRAGELNDELRWV